MSVENVPDPIVDRAEQALAAEVNAALERAVANGALSAIIDRSVDQALAKGPSTSPRGGWKSVHLVAVGTVGVVAILVGVLTSRGHHESEVAMPAPVVSVALPNVEPIASLAPTSLIVAAPEGTAPAKKVAVAARDPLQGQSAADLFARANQARRDGRYEEAMSGYGELEKRFPSSPEANLSRVTRGRLLLDRGGDLAVALGLFDAYLAETPSGTMAEQALAGRATALERLGRADEERAAWTKLLAAYPDSVHAAHAKERLGQAR